MSTTPICPVCAGGNLRVTVMREQLPAMQNYVHRTLGLARQAPVGQFHLSVCEACGFAFNSTFDPQLLDYDQGYDNSVPSRVMDVYYNSIAKKLYEKHPLRGGLVVDIGCGKGTFLKALLQQFPEVRGLGIDPSYEGALSLEGGRLNFKCDFFAAEQLTERPALVVCRHVLEHIPTPVAFLQSVKNGLKAYPDVPVFFEVPDAQWILESEAFWDFCYEHCNYFTPTSLHTCLSQAGFEPQMQGDDFGGQYLWIEARQALPNLSSSPLSKSKAEETLREFVEYAAREKGLVKKVSARLQDYHQQGKSIAIWGMATKGVVFAYLMDPLNRMLEACVDVNTNKQGCFVPVSGHRIEAPEFLKEKIDSEWVVVVMNPNYFAEIAQRCEAMGLKAFFMDASGKQWSESVIDEKITEVLYPIPHDPNISAPD